MLLCLWPFIHLLFQYFELFLWLSIQHPRNNEQFCRAEGPEVLSRILNYLLQTLSSLDTGKHNGVGDEELVEAVFSLCQF